MAFRPCVRSVSLTWGANRTRWRPRSPYWLRLRRSSVYASSDFTQGPLDTSKEPPSGSAEKPPHTPVLLKEVLHYLDIQRGEVVMDMTFGGGGHTKAILNAVPQVKVVALDRDPAAIALAEQLAEEHSGRVTPLLGRFSELEALLPGASVEPGGVDAVLLDAGCSSMQMDQAQRGFSLSKDGPLDMRMDGERYPDVPSAADVVNTLDQQALACILLAYGEERRAGRIAAAVVEARRAAPITGTRQLADVVAGAFPAAVAHARRDRLQRPAHVATKTFQALRIFVNDELNELHAGLRAARRLLRPGGRLCVITFHSLEDRLVKRFLRGHNLSGWDPLGPKTQGAGRAAGDADWLPIRRKVVTPMKEEVEENPRGRSAKLRAALRR